MDLMDDAIKTINSVRGMLHRKEKDAAFHTLLLAHYCSWSEDLKNARKYYKKCLESKDYEIRGIATCALCQLGDYPSEEIHRYYIKSAHRWNAYLKFQEALALYKSDKITDAINILRDVVKTLEDLGDLANLCMSEALLSLLTLEKKEIDDAIFHAKRCIEICKKTKFIVLEMHMYALLHEAYQMLDEEENAKKYARLAGSIRKRINKWEEDAWR